MGAPIFVNGLPAKITKADFLFRFAQNFPDLIPETQNEFVETIIDDVYSMFNGVNYLWDHMEPEVYFQKTQICFSLLVAWYITDLYPHYAVGILTSGGIPIRKKRISTVSIEFGNPDNVPLKSNYKDLLAPLRSNPFGYKAYQMIRSSSKVNYLYGGNVSAR